MRDIAMKRINLSVDDDFYRELEEAAAREERTIANLTLYLVKQAFREKLAAEKS
jgi:hypothetical protein